MGASNKCLQYGNTDMLILRLLSLGDKYGYEMMSFINNHEDLSYTLTLSNMYPILRELEHEGAVLSYNKYAGGTKRVRRYYTITPAGQELLSAKREKWERFRKCIDLIMTGEAFA